MTSNPNNALEDSVISGYWYPSQITYLHLNSTKFDPPQKKVPFDSTLLTPKNPNVKCFMTAWRPSRDFQRNKLLVPNRSRMIYTRKKISLTDESNQTAKSDAKPIPSMYGTYIYLHLPWKSTKCREIYHTWIYMDGMGKFKTWRVSGAFFGVQQILHLKPTNLGWPLGGERVAE